MTHDEKINLQLLSRRGFLKAAAGSAILLLVGCRTTQSGSGESPSGSEQSATAQSATATGSPTVAPATLVPRSREIEITPVETFYRQQFQGVPTVNGEEWTLTIDGLVERPAILTLDDVFAIPRAEMMRTLECIGNPVGGNQIGNARWAGFWLGALLSQVGVQPGALRVRFEAADGYETSVARRYVDDPGVLMAYEMNGEPLTPEHGYPLRIFMPGLYGQKMPKWITRLEFIAEDNHRGYWERQGWSEEAEVKTNSQIVQPDHIGTVPLSEIEIYGVAYAGNRMITDVEIGIESDDHLTWYPAELLAGPSNEVWTQFYYAWTPPEETSYTILVRATDETGFVQTERAGGILQGAFPAGTDKIHNIVVKAG